LPAATGESCTFLICSSRPGKAARPRVIIFEKPRFLYKKNRWQKLSYLLAVHLARLFYKIGHYFAAVAGLAL
jgi:hypothetical protein